MNKVVIVMAAWNEAENIEKMINELYSDVFPKIEAEMHLLVADNKSTDGMTEIVEKKMKEHNTLHIVQQGNKKGLGNAYIVGFKYAMQELSADAVMEMDADGQHPPRFVKPMVEAYLNGAEYVIGSRYIPGGSVPAEWQLFRKLVSYFGNLYIRIVLLKPKIHDLTTGFRLMKVKGVLGEIDLDNLMEKERFAYKVDLLFQCLKMSKKTVEVPLAFAARHTDKSKFNPKEMLATFKVATILGIRDKARFIKFGMVGFLGYLVNAFGLFFFSKFSWPEPVIWAAATEVAIINNFILNNLWTFKSEKISGAKRTVVKFLQFNLTSLGALIIQTVAGTIGVYFLGPGSRQLLLPFIIVFLVLPYNYIIYNVVIWKTGLFKKK
jgi:dolichol-phosphate mannosyltransferase